MIYDDTTPIAALTVADLKTLIRDLETHQPIQTKTSSDNYVYGIRGIEKLFGVSHRTAQYYKDHVIRDAVMQNGRKIVVNVDRALELFNERKNG